MRAFERLPAASVFNAVDAGNSGVVLMHSVQAITASALQGVIDGLRARGKTFVMVEDLVRAQYGKPSRQLFDCMSSSQCITGETCVSGHCAPTSSGDAGSDADADGGPSDTGVDTAPDTATIDSGVADSGDAGDAGSTDTGMVGDAGDAAWTWSAMPASPLAAREGIITAGDGRTTIVWGGASPDGGFLDGARF